jgi:hypothetical protein
MPDFAQVLSEKQRAKARLLAIPGIHAVGIGHKLTSGSSERGLFRSPVSPFTIEI